MTDPDETIQKVLEVRKVGADYEEHQQASPLDIPVDLHNFKKFPVVDPPGTHKPTGPNASPDQRSTPAPSFLTTADRSRLICGSRTSRTRLW